jgi:hypothetical protein
LREQIDIDALHRELERTVRMTVAPSTLSLWVR